MLKLHEKSRDDTVALMADIGRRARAAARPLAVATAERKHAALIGMAQAILRHEQDILDANAIDIKNGEQSGLSASFMDRLKLDPGRIRATADGISEIAGLRDPVGDVIAAWDRPNGLHIERVRTPLGVVGVIYESRPNVTADAGALCLKAGNPVILRGGSDSLNSSAAIHACLVEGLKAAKLPQDAIQLVPTADRAAVGEMLKGLSGNIDVIIPRGGKNLVERVQNEARVPVFAHLEGICHLYIDGSADLDMAARIAVNAKMRRTGVCGAAETLLVDRAVAATHLVPILGALRAAGCEIHADAEVLKVFADAQPATDADWVSEYLDAIIAVKLVDGVAGAIEHIETFSSHHTEAIVAEDADSVERFFNEIDSAILLHNASTQFADGGEFGMGAEIGIATGKMHARGPVGVEQLTSFKYRVRGTGQVRP
ncbi:glutamate-5-semialdehyde dehydrogenase [Mesorhizobium sp.]|uniref:glutamate-5-semialdehyde dehydrogenase n=1 Tax=Mesorhizobium sp. TaxID=1871066 RepID=UPI000FE8EDAB|nr:glutamate-5-semialdehyde dehydrogenase [Mesorhizobium sp.]RWQ57845.1 MAG: glutamate-5-semialdehyde dehydrogenase [Mesorhizobium sp.]